MILVDTSVWIDHLRSADPFLRRVLHDGAALAHPAVIGEVALGRIADRGAVLDALGALPRPVAATDGEVLSLIERGDLAGAGIGWVDAHLITATMLTAGASLWTRDRRLRTAAERLGVPVVQPRTDAQGSTAS